MKNYGWRNALMDILFIALGFLVAILAGTAVGIVLRSLPCGMCEGGPL